MIPTFVVIPVRDRHEYTKQLLTELLTGDGACERIFVFDNGSDVPAQQALTPYPPEVVVLRAGGSSVAQMWNDGFDLAESHAAAMGAKQWNVAVLNNDISVADDFLGRLAAALRCDDSLGLVYPNFHPGLPLALGEVTPTMSDSGTRRSMSGWAYMIAGELGIRVDERFTFYFTDDDVELQVREAGKLVAAVGELRCDHFEPDAAFRRRPDLQEQAREGWPVFQRKWAHVLGS